MGETAKRAAVATLVVIAIVAAALALWKLELVIALVFLGITIAAAMRPSKSGSNISPVRRRSCTRACRSG